MNFKCNLKEQWSIYDLGLEKKLDSNWQNREDDIILLASNILEKLDKCFYQLPFCNTLEAESLGAIVKYANQKSTNRISEAICKNLDDLIKYIDTNKSKDFEINDRAKAMFLAIKELKSKGKPIIFNITGPITILSYIVDIHLLIKQKRKNPEYINKLEDIIFVFLEKYIEYFKLAGVDLFSYADPIGNIDVLGKKYFENWTKPLLFRAIEIFKKSNVPVHICGMISCELENSNQLNLNKGSAKIIDKIPKEFLLYGKSCIQHW